MSQGHPRLFGCSVALTDVATQAGRCDVLPEIRPSSTARNDVVDGELIRAATAVLTGVMVSLKQVAAREWKLAVRDLDVLAKANHRRGVGPTPDFSVRIVFQAFCFPLQSHHHGATPRCDVQRFVGRIENENLAHASSQQDRHANEDLPFCLVTTITKSR